MRITIRCSLKPKHKIIRYRFFSTHVVCIEKFAIRILQRQRTGMRFFDPEYLDNPSRFRGLRGIEGENW